MGRYYHGDIEGKFAFGVQSSNAADRFGVVGVEPSYISYYFDEDNIEGIENELKKIENTLGDQLKIMSDFFEKGIGYDDNILRENNVDPSKIGEYFDYVLGKKILECIEEMGSCSFDAEL